MMSLVMGRAEQSVAWNHCIEYVATIGDHSYHCTSLIPLVKPSASKQPITSFSH